MAVCGHDNICAKIAEELGIKHCRKLHIKMDVDSMVIVEAEFFPEVDGVEQLEPILKEYYLAEKENEEPDESPIY